MRENDPGPGSAPGVAAPPEARDDRVPRRRVSDAAGGTEAPGTPFPTPQRPSPKPRRRGRRAGRSAHPYLTDAVIAAVITAAAAIIVARSPQPPEIGRFPFPCSQPPRIPFLLESKYHFRRWVGDGEGTGRKHVSLSRALMEVRGVPQIVTRVSYAPGPRSWGGVAWEYPFGDARSPLCLSLLGAREVSFLARGEVGGEVVQFRSGGTPGKYSDTFVVAQVVSLTADWRAYRIELLGENLSSVVSAFGWAAEAYDNGGRPITFYLADLQVK